MELNKWLKRKFPNQSDWLIENYRESEIQYLKDQKYNIGILKEDNSENKKGDFVIFKRHKEMIPENENGYEYPNKGGWSGGFEYYYHFAKKYNSYTNRGYVKLVDDLN